MALQNPERFAGAGSISGVVDITKSGRYRTEMFDQVFGKDNLLTGTEHDIMKMLSDAKAAGVEVPPMFTYCGTEDNLIECNRAFKQFGDQNGFSVDFTEAPGRHDHTARTPGIELFLEWMDKH